ncbi:MAG: 50S ribosomal protein L3 [Candidatus Odinarchaeota archaeon]
MGHRRSSPKRGSLSYLPRARADNIIGRIRNWPDYQGPPKILGMMGYKAGMTHAVIVETKPTSPWVSHEISVPLTIIDVPPLIVFAVRGYKKTPYGLRVVDQIWSAEVNPDLGRRLTVPKDYNFEEAVKRFESKLQGMDELSVLVHTQPKLAGISKKTPDVAEFRVGGGTVQERFTYLKNLLGKEIRARDIFTEGGYLDTISVSKGKGFQGPVKRWGIRILPNKSRKTVRGVGSTGPWHPARVFYTVPRAGQMGFHQRVEYNKRIIKIGEDPKEITPKGGFLSYSPVKRDYMLVEGTIPGTRKRLIKFRLPVRALKLGAEKPPQLVYVSLDSNQGA